ncbi:hypothetical protein PAPYR_8162 [Paratrimastix pyriformis]|uniref:Uncharacterized protein n=1 Tax=Paratrimastix pyriformis TaxID=342808 RepID=A0ABQ8UBC9_9EUKA|nr:hypothetical protein PAPYR_8162 [Paratrimastix pyriformis]
MEDDDELYEKSEPPAEAFDFFPLLPREIALKIFHELPQTLRNFYIFVGVNHYFQQLLSSWDIVDIRGETRLTDASVLFLAKKLTGLVEVDLTGCTGLSPTAVRHLAHYCPRLERLVCAERADSRRQWESTLKFLGSSEGLQLRELSLVDGSDTLGDQAMEALCGRGSRLAPRLQGLRLSHLGRVSERFWGALPGYCPQLSQLDMRRCGQVSSDHLMAIFRGMPRVASLTLSHCPKPAVTSLGFFAIPPAVHKRGQKRENRAKDLAKHRELVASLRPLPDLSALRELRLHALRTLEPDFLPAIGPAIQRTLGALVVSGCQRCSADAMLDGMYRVGHFPSLERLSLSHCNQDILLSDLATRLPHVCPGLRSLSLENVGLRFDLPTYDDLHGHLQPRLALPAALTILKSTDAAALLRGTRGPPAPTTLSMATSPQLPAPPVAAAGATGGPAAGEEEAGEGKEVDDEEDQAAEEVECLEHLSVRGSCQHGLRGEEPEEGLPRQWMAFLRLLWMASLPSPMDVLSAGWSCPNLRSLRTMPDLLADTFMTLLPECCPRLEVFDGFYCPNHERHTHDRFTALSMVELERLAPTLKVLRLPFWIFTDDEKFPSISRPNAPPRFFPHVHTVAICKAQAPPGWEAAYWFWRALPSLTALELSDVEFPQQRLALMLSLAAGMEIPEEDRVHHDIELIDQDQAEAEEAAMAAVPELGEGEDPELLAARRAIALAEFRERRQAKAATRECVMAEHMDKIRSGLPCSRLRVLHLDHVSSHTRNPPILAGALEAFQMGLMEDMSRVRSTKSTEDDDHLPPVSVLRTAFPAMQRLSVDEEVEGMGTWWQAMVGPQLQWFSISSGVPLQGVDLPRLLHLRSPDVQYICDPDLNGVFRRTYLWDQVPNARYAGPDPQEIYTRDGARLEAGQTNRPEFAVSRFRWEIDVENRRERHQEEELAVLDDPRGCTFPGFCLLPLIKLGIFEGIPDHVWLFLSDTDASFRLHCILSAINHRFRALLTQTTRFCWTSEFSEDRARRYSEYRATRPPFALILRRCAFSLQSLSISDPFDFEDAEIFLEADLRGLVFPQMRTLIFPLAPLWFLRLCPNLKDLTINQEPFSSRPSFERFLRDRPSLQSLEAHGLSLSYFGLRGQPRHRYSAVVRATAAGEGIVVGTPASVRGLTMEQCDPDDLPVLLADWPNLERLQIIPEKGATIPLGDLSVTIQDRAPNLHQLELTLDPRVPILPEELEPVDSLLTGLSASLDLRDPLLLLPAGLRVCDLDLQTDLTEATLYLPLTEELTLRASEPLKEITLCCPALVAFRMKAREFSLCSSFTIESQCRMPHLCTVTMEDFDRDRDVSGLKRQDGGPVDLDALWKTELPDFWRVRNLEVHLAHSHGAGQLRVPPGVKRLVVSSPNLTAISAPGLQSLRIHGKRARDLSGEGRFYVPVELDTPQLEQLEVREDWTCVMIDFSGGGVPRLHTLIVHDLRRSYDSEFQRAFTLLIQQCQGSLKRLFFPNQCGAQVAIDECPALQQLWCPGSIELRSPCPFLDHLGLTAPTVYRRAWNGPESLVPVPALSRAPSDVGSAPPTSGGTDWDQVAASLLDMGIDPDALEAIVPMLRSQWEGRSPTLDQLVGAALELPIKVMIVNSWSSYLGWMEEGPHHTLIRVDNGVPSVLLERLRQDRPDVLILSCPCISDALLLRTFNTPHIRPLYALDLGRIIQLSGAPVRVVLHHLKKDSFTAPCHTFLVDLFETCKRQGLLVAGRINDDVSGFPSFFRSLAEMGMASAVDALKDSGIYDATTFVFEGNRPPPPPPPDPFAFRIQRAREVGALFADVPLGELADALARRSPEFACQCPASIPPRFRLLWPCHECSKACPNHDPVESCIVLPDPASPLACLPLLRENLSILGEKAATAGVPNLCFGCLLKAGCDLLMLDSCSYPMAECVGCHTRGLRMRSGAIAALPPFDERPFDEPIPRGQPAIRPQRVLSVLCVALNPDPAVDPPGLAKLSAPGLLQKISKPDCGFEVGFLCEPSAQALQAKIRELRPDLVIYVGHGLRQGISIRGDAGMSAPLTWLGPDEFVGCFEDGATSVTASTPPRATPSPVSAVRMVLLACCNSLALGDHLLRRLAGSGGGLERVVATADELTDVEACGFLSALLAYAPFNPVPAALDEIMQVSLRRAQRARETFQEKIDPTTPLVLVRPRRLAFQQHRQLAAGTSGGGSPSDNVFSRGPTLAEAIHAIRALARPLECLPLIPMRCTCGCPNGPQFAIEFAKGCIRPAAPEGPLIMTDASSPLSTACTAQAAAGPCTALAAASQPDPPMPPEQQDSQHREEQEPRHEHDIGGWCTRCDPLVAHDRVLLPYAQRCKRCGQAAFIIPRDLPSAFKAPPCTPISVTIIDIDESWKSCPLEEGSMLKIDRVADALPSVLLERLRQDRPDVLIISCPCISDALLLRTTRAPNLRPLYALDLARIIEQSGAPVSIVLHHSPSSSCHTFLADLFALGRQQGLLVAGEIRDALVGGLPSFFRSLAEMGIASAVDALKDSQIYEPAAFVFEGHRPTPPPSRFNQYARELRAHFPDVRLGELEGALERRSHEFACQCPASTPPRFRLVWPCGKCSQRCPDRGDDDPIESCIVLPDPAARPLACLPLIRKNASRLTGDPELAEGGVPAFCVRCLLNGEDSLSKGCGAFPLAECVGCHTRGLRMRSDAIAALPPFDERPTPQQHQPQEPLPLISQGDNNLSPMRVLFIAPNPDPTRDEPSRSSPALIQQEISAFLNRFPDFGLEVSLLCEPSAQALKAEIRRLRPDLVIYVGHGLRQAISIRGEAGMTKPLTWLGPDELLRCFDDCATPASLTAAAADNSNSTSSPSLSLSSVPHPHAVLLVCCNSLALGDHLLRGSDGGLERVVATADELTDVEASRFLSALLAYAPHNLMPAALDEILQVSFRQAQQARATYKDQIDPTTPLVLIGRPRTGSVRFSRGPTLAEAIHATRALGRPLEDIPLRCTCGCPDGPRFAIESAAQGCIRPAAPEWPTAIMGSQQEQQQQQQQQQHESTIGGWCMRCGPHVTHAGFSFAQRCQRCGQAAFIIPRDLPKSTRAPAPAVAVPRDAPARVSSNFADLLIKLRR